jgi:hypothetical protein
MHHLEGMTGRGAIIPCGRCPAPATALDCSPEKREITTMQSEDPSSSTGGQAASGAAPGDPTDPPSWREIRMQRAEPELAIYGWLLGLIATVFAVEGVVTLSDPILIVLTALLGITTVLALHVAHARSYVRRAAAVLAVALVVTTIVQAATGGVDRTTAVVADALLVSIAPLAILIGVVRRLNVTRAVTVESVVGVICVYLLLGMLFAFVYGSIDQIGTAPFFAQNVAATASRLQYYSFTTLATVGYGDLTAASSLGHTLSVSEALLGQVYLVTVVSLIVGNLGRRGR